MTKPTHQALKTIADNGGFDNAGQFSHLVFLRDSDYFRAMVAISGADGLDYLTMRTRMESTEILRHVAHIDPAARRELIRRYAGEAHAA